jgi:hypothetical protein
VTCFYCGTDLPTGAMFCGECGRPVNTRGGRSLKVKSAATDVVEQIDAESAVQSEPGVDDAAEPLPESEPLAETGAEPDAEPGPDAELPPQPTVEPEAAVELEPEALAESEPLAESEAEPEVPAEPEVRAEPEVPVEAESLAEHHETAVEPEPEPEPLVEPESEVPVEAESLAESVPDVLVEPEALVESESEPEPEPLVEPEPVAVAAPRPAPSAGPAEPPPAAPVFRSRAAAHDAAAAPERCAQCGAPLAPSDIFCPECGFVRQRTTPRSRPNDTNVLDPFPWGLPRPTETPVAHRHASIPFEPEEPPLPPARDVKPFAEIADVAETRLVPRGPRGERFVLQFSTGESISVSGSGLIGRNPVAEPGEYFDSLVAIVDPGRSVSKTHLEFGQDGTSFWVSDRYSGNGTVVREPDREPRRCEAGKRYRVARGARVEIGEQFFIVS